ncbi:hypothetical protein [Inhella crocodyli]|uniref:Uncharacterized protein n=1 Tax=Inhella crocodyli TaxID=2499851 RepID=A0A3S2UHP9_9BURK|nr:hypothetical protein [Inhella crocodyli]RVT88345.1 hypothetical protein EOD73_05000 [Inhella crocodyli]
MQSVWARLQFALQHPVDTVETPGGRAHVALGLMRFSESSDGRLAFSRWRRTYKGMVWMPPQSPAEALIEFEDLPNGHTWQADLYAACAFEIHQAERAAGRTPNSGYIHAYVYRCVAPMLRALRQQPEWRTLGRRIQDGLQVDRASMARARRMLRFDRGSRPCTIDLYNLSVANRQLFDRADQDPGTFPGAELMLGTLLRVQKIAPQLNPLTRLRRELMDTGRVTIKPSTWRQLLTLTPAHLRLIEEFYEGKVWPQVVDFLLCLETLKLETLPSPMLLRRVFAQFANSSWRHPSHLREFEAVPRDFAHAVRAAAAAEVSEPALVRDEFPQVADWLRQVDPGLSKLQRRAGWAWLRQRSMQWHQAQHERWNLSNQGIPCPFEPMEWGAFRLEAIHDAVTLFDEGEAMGHCIFSRLDDMLSGTSLLVSIRSREGTPGSWKRVATAECHHDPDRGWFLKEAQGPANQDPGSAVRDVAQRLVTTLNQQASGTRSREFYCPRTASLEVRQRRGCPIGARVEIRLKRLNRALLEGRWFSAESFTDKFWRIERSDVPLQSTERASWMEEAASTSTVFSLLDRGYSVTAMDGPFETEEDAIYALDVAWESSE